MRPGGPAPYGSGFGMQSLEEPLSLGEAWNLSEDVREFAEDLERLQELYPDIAKEILRYAEEACDELEYEGSMMYDEQPDKIQFRNIAGKIYDKKSGIRRGKTGLAIWCRWCCCRKCAGDGKNAENREDGIE